MASHLPDFHPLSYSIAQNSFTLSATLVQGAIKPGCRASIWRGCMPGNVMSVMLFGVGYQEIELVGQLLIEISLSDCQRR
jgi:hypothetical protein